MFLSSCYPRTQKLQSFWLKEMLDSNMATKKIQLEAAWITEQELMSSKYICGENVSLWKVLERLEVIFLLVLGKNIKPNESKQRHRMGWK